ncbi:unnamed protein product [Candida verbasci]|uniref:BioF2-like acetyltransferase domain-containing protein n=1 Tax=Candida verbasci TaxID=1227364 RepID=A0A9W4TY19_9ASCO|nr:unnamed protein product [Candida verbasci]
MFNKERSKYNCINNNLISSFNVKPSLKWFYNSFAIIFYSFIFNLIDAIIYTKFTKSLHYINISSIIAVITDFLILLIEIYNRFFIINYTYNSTEPKIDEKNENKNKNSNKNSKNHFCNSKWSYYTYLIIDKVIKKCLWILLLILCILKVVSISSGKIENPLDLNKSDLNYLNMSPNNKIAYLIISILALLANSALLSIWWSTTISSVYLLFASINFIQIMIAISIIQINVDLINLSFDGPAKKMHNLFILCGSFMIGQSIMGLSIVLLINEKNRLNELIGKLIFFYDIFIILIGLLLISCTSVASIKFDYKPFANLNEIPISLPILFGLSVGLNLLEFFCTRYFRFRKVINQFIVEEYDLINLTNHQKQGWSKLIDLNHKYNNGISGEYAISLMENYINSDLPGMNCKVLRVYKDNNNNMNNNNSTKQHNESSKNDKSFSSSSSSPYKHYNKNTMDTAFDTLDHESLLFSNAPTLCSTTNDMKNLEEEFKPISKSKLKRLNKKKQQEKQKLEYQSLENNTEKFYNELMNTEALVLLTIITDFDLSERIPGWIGKKLNKLFGKNSKFPILCIKFGLLGFHWPFKRSTFYCSSTRKPIARSSSILYAISKWNNHNEKCTVLLDPTYKDADLEASITYSGWYKIYLPNSHIIDLRPYNNQSSTEYFKAIKYRNQENAFKQANGQVIETNIFNFENCQEIIHMNQNISNSRVENGQSSQLVNANWEFIYNLGNFSNEKKFRSLLFLKVDNTVIASCVIFRLGDTITSDIQGLDHEISKKYKAYFVMMQEVIKIALRENVSFVDFGPTTENAKVTIGCNVVPLLGSIYPKNKFLGPIIKFAASKVDV